MMITHYLPVISKLVQNSTGSYRTIAYSEEYQSKNLHIKKHHRDFLGNIL